LGRGFFHQFNSKLYGCFSFSYSSYPGFALTELNTEQNSPGFQLVPFDGSWLEDPNYAFPSLEVSFAFSNGASYTWTTLPVAELFLSSYTT